MRLATDLGPKSECVGHRRSAGSSTAPPTRWRATATSCGKRSAQLSGVGRILANGSGNIVDIIKNLQTFVTALRDSNVQIVQFNDRLATLTSVVNDSKSDLDAALTDLSTAVGEVQRFIAGTRDQTSEQIQRLANVTQTLVDHHMALENILHVAPNAFAQLLQRLQPRHRNHRGRVRANELRESHVGVLLLLPFPAARRSAPSRTSPRSNRRKLCALFLGPGLRLLNFNNLPFPINPFLQPSRQTRTSIIYTEPRLAPGGEGPKPGPPEIPPAVSAYTGLPGDPVGPPGAVPPARIPGAAMPLPPAPSTPMAPPPPPTAAGAAAGRRDAAMIARVAALRRAGLASGPAGP